MHNFNEKLRFLIKPVIFLVILAIMLRILSFAVAPVDVSSRYMMHELYNQDGIDIVFSGASRYYTTVYPEVIDERMGLNTFNLSSASQGIMDSYYLLREMYKYYTPKLVVLDVSLGKFRDRDSVMQSLIVYDYMKPSFNKLSYLLDVFEPDYYMKAIFPAMRESGKAVLRSPDELLENVGRKLIPEWRNYDYASSVYNSNYYGKGYMYRKKGLEEGSWGDRTAGSAWDGSGVSDERIEYYKKIVKLCRDNGSEIIFFNPPRPLASLSQIKGYSDYLEFMDEFVQETDVEFYNFEFLRDEVLRPKESYFYDTKHANVEGATAISTVLAEFLTEYLDGTLNTEDYLYGSFGEMLENTNYVFYTRLREAEGENDLIAKSNAGNNVTVEFQFLYRPLSDQKGEFTVYREYSENPYAELSLLESGSYQIRVNARAKNSVADYEQYYIYDLENWEGAKNAD